MQAQIPPEIFYGNVQRLLDTWNKKHDQQFDSIIINNGKASPGNQKTVSILSWFVAGYNLADTLLFFTKSEIYIYTSQRKIKFLQKIAKDPNAKKYNLNFVQKQEDNINCYKRIWESLHAGKSKPKVGVLINDTKIGAIAQDFDKFIKSTNHDEIQIFNFFNECFEKKSTVEIDSMKKSGKVTAYFQSKFIKEVQHVIDNGKRTKHKELTTKITQLMGNEAQLKKIALKFKEFGINKDYIDAGPVPSIQSGQVLKHKLFAQADQSDLKSDCIFLGLGSIYRSYNSYVSRTLLIDPTQYQKNIYKKVQTLSKVIIQNLRIGIKICDVYKIAKRFVQEHLKDLQLPKVLGFGIGVFLKENTLTISQTNDKVIQPGNVFLVDVTFTDIKYELKKGGKKTFGIQLIDTVVVQEKGHQILTNAVSKALNDISYYLQDDEQPTNKKKQSNLPQKSNIIQGNRRRRRNEITQQKFKNLKQRTDHQKALKLKKLQQLKQRINQNFSGDLKKQKVIQASKIDTYRHREDLPKDIKKNLIYIDNKNNAILLPVNGTHIPFHIHLLKSVVKSDQGKFSSLRFNFHLPNSISNLSFPKFAQPSVFVKELVFRSTQGARFAQIQKQVKALQKKIKMQASQKNAKEDIVQQEKINLNRGKRPILRDLFPRPTVGQKKTKGNLECHINGFRYTTAKGQSIDIAFNNIKFAFFQPCQNQIIAAIHFRLHQPIIVAKKKTEDIQFYSEGGTSAEDVVGRRGGRQDSDDQERQKQTRKKIDRQFLAWTRACQQFIGNQFTFEIPDRNKGFYGTPFKGNCLIQPTQTCLINVTQIPFFVLNINDIQVACFQRMYANLRSFDITLVYKDYENHIRINSIPIKDVERVKDFLDDNNIIFYDLGKSMNWPKFLAGIRYDFKKFVQDGGWTAWDDDQQAQEVVSQGDSQFSASGSQLQQESQSGSDDDQQSDYDQDDDDEDSQEDQEDLSQEGLSWDQMQQRAEREDRERMRREIEKEKFVVKKKR